jgi:lipopolysaccharide transport protein LptA
LAAKPSPGDPVIPQAPPAKPASKPVVYTVVHAAKLVYTDTTRLADYTGNVEMTRPNINIKSGQMQAFLNPKDSKEDSRLHHMLADGNVEIHDKAADRTRTSKGDHGEYYTADSRIVISGNSGNNANMVDSKKGDIVGKELTYFSDDDRLLVKGEPQQPVKSRLHRKQ